MEIGQQIGRVSDRGGADFWETPACAVWDFLRVAPDIQGPILEPAAGRGAISKVLIQAGYKVESRDLYNYDFGTPGVDFLESKSPEYWPTIITNPPYNQAAEFVKKAVEIAGVSYFLLPLYFMTARKRLPLMQDHLKRVFVFTYRVPFRQPGYKKPLNHKLYAWFEFVFESYWEGPPSISFIAKGDSE